MARGRGEEDDVGKKDKPTDNIHLFVTKVGLFILAFGLLILLFPLWDTIDGVSQAELARVPYTEQFAALKDEERRMVEADPESPRLLELREKQRVVFNDLRIKSVEWRLARRKMLVTMFVMLVSLAMGGLISLLGLYLSYDYRAQFVEKPPASADESREE